MPTKRILFCRIGYMTYYAGPQAGDEKPIGGGKYNKTGVGHEIWNFQPVGNLLYGYFEPYVKSNTDKETSINLKRIDPNCDGDELADTLIVFFATRPKVGQVVVGWYSKATVFQYRRKHSKKSGREGFSYYMTAEARNCVLLPSNRRTLSIPRKKKAPGRPNVYYLYDEEFRPRFSKDNLPKWLKAIVSLISEYDGPNLFVDLDAELEEDIDLLHENAGRIGGQGFNLNKRDRKIIEKYAMRRALERYGAGARDVSSTKSYDIHLRMGSRECFIEVKGTQTNGASVILTKNEANLMKRVLSEGHNTILFVVHNVILKGRGKKRHALGGKERIIKPFDVQKVELLPLSYKCTLPVTA